MEFSEADLVELRTRCLMASQRGYAIARADEYMEALEAESGMTVEGMPTAAQLYEAASLALDSRLTGKPKKKADKKVEKVEKVEKKEAKPAPAPKVVEVKPEPPKPEPAKEEPKVVEVKDEAPKDADKPEEVPPYEEWTYDELYAEAQARDIPGRSALKNKEALALALYENDEEKAKKAQ
jgi:outer membrane biosynthesis protein TonB